MTDPRWTLIAIAAGVPWIAAPIAAMERRHVRAIVFGAALDDLGIERQDGVHDDAAAALVNATPRSLA
ncbi:MAG: hypothetical protein WDO73_05790 [Ignavibacteriota bacterium]